MTPTYTAAEVLTFIAAFGVLIGGLGAVIVNIIVALRTGKQLEVVNAKADVITGHVNSASDRAAAQIAVLQREVSLMRAVIAEKRETAALLAQAVTLGPPTPHLPPGPSVEASLRAIDANTDATAKNTARSEEPEPQP
jgi:hypothetical protein